MTHLNPLSLTVAGLMQLATAVLAIKQAPLQARGCDVLAAPHLFDI